MGTAIVTVLGVMGIIAVSKCMIGGFAVLGYIVSGLYAALMIGGILVCKDKSPKENKMQAPEVRSAREVTWSTWLNDCTLGK